MTQTKYLLATAALIALIGGGVASTALNAAPATRPSTAAPKPADGTDAPLEPMRLPKGTRVLKDLAYVANPSPNQHLDLYLPEVLPEKPMPVIVFFHGGAWHKGTKDRPSAAVKFVPKGYAVASVEYRFTQEAPFPAQIHDAKAAVRYLRAHAGEYHFDTSHFASWGTSAGGHLAALLGTSNDNKDLEGDLGNAGFSSSIQAVVDCYGPADLSKHMINPSLNALLGGTPEEKPDVARQASPLTFVSKSSPPFLILHGDADPVVPVDQSKAFAAALKTAGADVTLMLVPGGGHGGDQFKLPEYPKAIEAFLERTMKGK